MQPILQTCTPRQEVLKGDLEDAIFAADFGHVVEGRAPSVYQESATFFANTHPTANLTKLVRDIFAKLASPDEAGAAVRLSTGFGGGKTHTLITLWHLAKTIQRSDLGTELLPAAGRPNEVVTVGIDGGKGFATGTLWGDLAVKLGALTPEAARKLTSSPDATTLRSWLPDKPLLILLDELVIAMSEHEQQQGALLAFLNRLIAEVGARKQAVLVITDPAGQSAYAREATLIGKELDQIEAAKKLDDILARKVSDFDPIGNEAPQVINRRLFARVDSSAASAASKAYFNSFKRVQEDAPDTLPATAATADYANRIVQCYPFHPRLLDTAQDRLGPMPDYQKGRGTLRLFARILRDVWEANADIPLISAGEINWESPRIQADLLNRLNRDQFKSAVSADISGHAALLDDIHQTDIHRRVASALLLESLPMTPTSAMDKRELTLATLRPSDVGHEPGEAMDRLMADCWHTYRDDSGTRYQFRIEPNLNKQIEERAESIPFEDARSAVLTEVQGYFTGPTFTLSAYPSTPRQVSDTARPKLVLSDDSSLAQQICDFDDASDPNAPRRRRFRNAILAIAPNTGDLNDAVHAKRREMAAEEISKEKRGDKLQKQQVDDLLVHLRRQARIAATRSFSRVIFQGRQSLTLEEQYLVNRDAVLDKVLGQPRLKQFLDDKRLVFQPGDAIDVDLLLASLVQGATPSLDHPGAVDAKSVHERALASEKLRLLHRGDPVRNSILKAVQEGRLLLRTKEGDVYDATGAVKGPSGARKRVEPASVPTFDLEYDVLLATPDAACAAIWLSTDDAPAPDAPISVGQAAAIKFTSNSQVYDAIQQGLLDTESGRGGDPLVLQNERFAEWVPEREGPVITNVAHNWDDAIAMAQTRPLRTLKLTAKKPAAAKILAACAQPFGAQNLMLSVKVGGTLKDGGTLNYAIKGVKHSHALKPLEDAERFMRALADGALFEAALDLSLEEQLGSIGSAPFERAREQAGDDIQISAVFGEEARQ